MKRYKIQCSVHFGKSMAAIEVLTRLDGGNFSTFQANFHAIQRKKENVNYSWQFVISTIDLKYTSQAEAELN